MSTNIKEFLKKHEILIIKIGMSVFVAGAVVLQLSFYKSMVDKNIEYKQQQEEKIEGLEDVIESVMNQSEEIKKELESSRKENEALKQEKESLNNKVKEQETLINSGAFVSAEEIGLMEKIVEAEAGAESLEGKIAVANVIINRKRSGNFPNTIKGVIFQKNQFQPVSSGAIHSVKVSSESKEAVKRALNGEKVVQDDVLYFWAVYVPRSHELWNNVNVIDRIGVHVFGESWGE